ncbi:MAG: HYR domain-containing protein [Bacteroidota bacterium]|nr:HYR domain-containing protein [Bacteroidota bacterium]
MKKKHYSLLPKIVFIFLLTFFCSEANSQLETYKFTFKARAKPACTFPPIITCPPNFSSCPGVSTLPSNTGIATALPGGTGCDQPIVTYTDHIVSQGPCTGAIEINRSWTARDPQNSLLNSSCLQIIKLSDVIAPVFMNCPRDTTLAANADCFVNVTWNPPSIVDNCGRLFLTVTHISGDRFPIGRTTVTYTGEDLCGNQTICTFNINVTGACCTKPPALFCPTDYRGCPGDSIVPNKTGKPGALAGGPNCSAPLVSYTDSITSTGPCPGSIDIIRKWTASDPFDTSLRVSCLQRIVLIDDSAPTIQNCPPNITLAPGINCQAIAFWIAPSFSDVCGIKSVSSNFNPGSAFNEGVTMISYVAIDNCDKVVTCSFTITVSECCNDIPTIQCPPDYISCPNGSTDSSIAGVAEGLPGQAGCMVPTISYTDEVISLGPCIGAIKLKRKWKASDPNHSNLFAECIQNIELRDLESPSFLYCPPNITVNPNQNCKAVVQWIAPTAVDNCSQPIVTKSHNPGDTFSVGTTTVTYTATDACGNRINHVFTITVPNTCCALPPKLNCPKDFIGCPTSGYGPGWTGHATATAPQPECGIPVVTYRDSILSTGTCPNERKLIRIWKAKFPNFPDIYSICHQTIDLFDRTPPVFTSCPSNFTVNLTACDLPGAVHWQSPVVYDNCGSVSIKSNYNSGHVFSPGVYTIIYTATDICGNSKQHSFIITVIGGGLKIKCPNDIIVDRTDPNLNGAYVNWNHPTVTSCGSCKDSLPGFIYMGELNGHKYYCSLRPATWSQAKAISVSHGGNLASISSPQENSWVTSKLMGQSAFIGLHDSRIEGLWEWLDGSPLTYTNWYPGQPNGANGDQDYVEILPDGTWNDQYSDCVREYICEIPCYTVKQIAGPPCGSLFPCGTTKVTYVAKQNYYTDTCSFNVTVRCTGKHYCESKGWDSQYMWIQCVELANVNNCSGNNGGYANFTNPCINLAWGNSYNLCLTPGFLGTVYTVYWRIWIDYNDDGDFDDSNEYVGYGSGKSKICGVITVPGSCYCPMSSSRMRISMAYGGYPGNPCCMFTYGEVEDYCVQFARTLNDDDQNTISSDLKIVKIGSESLLEYNLDAKLPGDLFGVETTEESTNPSDLIIYPIPTADFLYANLASGKIQSAAIYSTHGKRLLSVSNDVNESKVKLDVSNLNEGIYLLQVEDEQSRVYTKKFMVKR